MSDSPGTNKGYFITGIGTGVGKTVVSAIVAEALQGSYWKPIQAGDLENSDSLFIESHTENVKVLPEAFKLSEPMSPHAASQLDGVHISRNGLLLPDVKGPIIVEGAGGIMVPINNEGLTFHDLISQWKLPVIIVSRHYLGSINHTLLTADKLINYDVAGIIFVGNEIASTEKIILEKTKLKLLARIPEVDKIDKEFIAEKAKLVQL